jgi:hypothetical protein
MLSVRCSSLGVRSWQREWAAGRSLLGLCGSAIWDGVALLSGIVVVYIYYPGDSFCCEW